MTFVPSEYLIGLVLFGLIITSGVYIAGELHASYSDTILQSDITTFNSTFNQLNQSKAQADSIKNTMQSQSVQATGAFGFINALVGNAWNVLKMLFNNFGFMTSVFEGISNTFGIPTFITGSIITLIGIGLVFSIISAIMNRSTL